MRWLRILISTVFVLSLMSGIGVSAMEKYDDASWHYGGDFPDDLPDIAGATHTGMFVAWAFLNGMAGELHTVDFPEDITDLSDRKLTPGNFFYSRLDGKFTDEDLADEGDAFASFYFSLNGGQYWIDYVEVFDAENLPSVYHVEDSWENYEKLKSRIDARYKNWKAEHN
jgi:hypothetical protein